MGTQKNLLTRPLWIVVRFTVHPYRALVCSKQPIYFAERNCGTDGAAEAVVNSANTMSVTALEGR
jgi:hypothetical protein